MEHLICDRDHRYGFAEIQRHPFFHGLDWDRMRELRAPNEPVVESATDARYFDDFNEERTEDEERERSGENNYHFQDYTYARPAAKKGNVLDLFQ